MASFFSKLFGGGGTAEGAEKGIAERNEALKTGTTYAEGKTGQAVGEYDEANKWLDPSYQTANLGNQAYARAMGLGTPEEMQAEYAKFRGGPVDWAVKDAADQNARIGALSGSLASTTTQQRIADATAGKLTQGWGDYVNRLRPYVDQAPQIAGQRANIDVGQGNLWNTLGNTILGAGMTTANNNAASWLEKGKGEDAGAGRLLDTVLGAAKLAGNIIAPGSGALFDLAGQGLASANTGGKGYGTGTRGQQWW